MTAAAGFYLAACLLLAAAGGAKVRRPAGTRAAVRALLGTRLPVPGWAVQAGGVAEIVLAAAAFATPSRGTATAVAACYAAFAAFVAASLARGTKAGCGCFGQPGNEVPLGPIHLPVDLALAAAAVAVASAGGLGGSGGERAVVSVGAAGLAWVVYLVLVPLPLLAAAREPVR